MRAGGEGTEAQDFPRREFEKTCFHALNIIERSCEYLDMHMERYGADSDTRLTVKDIEVASAKLSRTLGEMMALLACLRGEVLPRRSSMDVWAVLRRMLSHKPMIKSELGIILEADKSLMEDASPCVVYADESWCEQICMHLLSNAMHACDSGDHITIGLQRNEKQARIIVADDGCGLPGDTEESRFENHRRFIGSAHAGLLLCREYCRLMGWELELRPREGGKGTEAVVTLPLGYISTTAVLRSDTEYENDAADMRFNRFLFEEIADIRKDQSD